VKVYVDTSVILDYLQDRRDHRRPLGEFAFQLFKRAASCEFKVVVSDWALEELARYASNRPVDGFAGFLGEKLERMPFTYADVSEAKALSRNWRDALHAVLARKAGAAVLVTRNISHFAGFGNLVEPKEPEHV
jgi:predicted nucleic acid-binding protein